MPNPLMLYDNYERSLRPFVPLRTDGEVGLYACGPTVYDYQHIGNFRTSCSSIRYAGCSNGTAIACGM